MASPNDHEDALPPVEDHVNLYQEESDSDEEEDVEMKEENEDESNTALIAPKDTSNTHEMVTTTSAASFAAAPPLLSDQQQQPPPPSSEPPLIRPMPEQTVRRIVAGQAILDLSSAVKELLDNALDAKSTSINIRLFNQGIDVLEVSDDGVGVPRDSRPFLATPHATSKIQNMDDLRSCSTLGFRGEALYSLAHLSGNLVVATRTANEALAQKMEFHQTGQLVEGSVMDMPRKVGTTVCVAKFLEAVPVRRADLLRRMPSQRLRLIQLVQQYALFAYCGGGGGGGSSSSAGNNTSSSSNDNDSNNNNNNNTATTRACQVRLMDMISHNNGSATERIILQTPHVHNNATSTSNKPPPTLGHAISAVLGAAVLQQLCEVSINVTDTVQAELKRQAESEGSGSSSSSSSSSSNSEHEDHDDDTIHHEPIWKVSGYLSKATPAANHSDEMDSTSQRKAKRRVGHIPTTNTGNPNQHHNNHSTTTSANGHQFFCINGRPVELPKLARLLNEQWRSCCDATSASNEAPAKKKKKSKKRSRPSIILQFTLPYQAYDVNLSPDKRQPVLLGEDEIYERIAQVVSGVWQSQSNTDPSSCQFPSESTVLAAAAASSASPKQDQDDNDILSPEAAAAAAAAPSPDQLEGSGRFNRRYAFSHDVRKARLQHEFDDGRKRGGSCDGSGNDDDDDEEEEERRRPDYNNYQPGYGHDANDDHLDAMLWQKEQIKRQLEQQEREMQRQQQHEAAKALFAARQKEQASSSSKSSSSDEKKQQDEAETKMTESSRLSLDNSVNAAAAAPTLAASLSVITPSPPAPRFLQGATLATKISSAAAVHDRDSATSDAERRQWQATQQKFNHSRDEEDGVVYETTAVLPQRKKAPPSAKPPEKDDILLRLNQFRAAGAAPMDSSTNKGNLSCIGTANSAPKKKSPTFTLEQFGFQKSEPAKTTKAGVESRKRPRQDSNDDDDDSSEETNEKDKDERTGNDYRNDRQHSSTKLPIVSLHDLQSSESTATATPSVTTTDTAMDDKQSPSAQQLEQQQQQSLSDRHGRKRRRLPSVAPASASEDPEQQQQEEHATTEMNVEDDSPRSFAEDSLSSSGNSGSTRSRGRLSQANELPAPTITWDAFAEGGTNQVLLESRRERLAMHERKQRLREIHEQQQSEGTDQGDPDRNNLSAASSSSSRIVTLGKDDFNEMTVIGQYNKGFILTKSRNNHLWIMDQHACDEKYNFEKLVAETVIHEQRLIAPMSLELSPAEETCILDNMDIFEKNGFRFEYRADAAPRHRLALTALPHSGARDGRKAVQFGKEDVSALCMILGCGDDGTHNDDVDDEDDGDALYRDGAPGGGTGADGSGKYGNNAVRNYAHASRRGTAAAGNDTADKVIARLPKAIAMFASRACRSSIMIGRALSATEMERIIKHLGELEHPWTCAHGRPTMHHVSNIGPLLRQDEHKAAEHRAGPTVSVLSQEATDPSGNDDDEEEF